MNPMQPISPSTPLLADVRQLIDAARQRVASTVNAELMQLYGQIGNRVNVKLLQGQRVEYGKQVIAVLTEIPNPRKYWSVLKTRLKKEGSELATSCSQLKMESVDGKNYLTDVADSHA